MSNLVPAQESKPARRGRKAKETAQDQQAKTVKIDSVPVAVEAEDTGEGSGLIQAAVEIADAELAVAAQAYNERTNYNTGRLLNHIRNTQRSVGSQIRQQIQSSYGVNVNDIYTDGSSEISND